MFVPRISSFVVKKRQEKNVIKHSTWECRGHAGGTSSTFDFGEKNQGDRLCNACTESPAVTWHCVYDGDGRNRTE